MPKFAAQFFSSLLLASSALLSAAIIHIATPQSADAQLEPGQSSRLDAVLVIDSSGSMLLSDPKKLRNEGALLFINSLQAGDRLAIIEFSEKARVVRELTEYSPEQAKAIEEQIAKIENTGIYTDLLSGVKLAQEILQKSSKAEGSRAIVLLSDGKMEPDPASGSAEARSKELFNSSLPELKSKEIKVHTLAFSDKADSEMLKQIAAATDGVGMFTPDAESVHQSFTNLFLAVKKPQVLPLSTKGFNIDADVQEATFYINRDGAGEIKILSPSGKVLRQNIADPTVKWFAGQKFDVVTIATPEPGKWTVQGMFSNDGFATLLTNLKLITDWPSAVNADEPTLLRARLYESEKPVVLNEISGALSYAFQIVPTDKVSEPIMRDFLKDDGTNGDVIANDGTFSAKIQIENPGQYMLKVVAHSPTFDRYQHLPFSVRHPLIRLHVSKAHDPKAHDSKEDAAAHGEKTEKPSSKHEEESHQGSDHEKGHAEPQSGGDTFVADLSPEAADLKKSKVELIAVDKDHNRYVIEMHQASHHSFEVPASALPSSGLFEVEAVLSGTGKAKKQIKAHSKRIEYAYQKPGETKVVHIEAPKEVPKEEEAPEEPSPLLYIIVATLWNLAAGAAAFILFRNASTAPAIDLPQFDSGETMKAALASLREKVKVSEIDLSDPIFAGGAPSEPTPEEPSSVSTIDPPSDGQEQGQPEDSTAVATPEPAADLTAVQPDAAQTTSGGDESQTEGDAAPATEEEQKS